MGVIFWDNGKQSENYYIIIGYICDSSTGAVLEIFLNKLQALIV